MMLLSEEFILYLCKENCRQSLELALQRPIEFLADEPPFKPDGKPRRSRVASMASVTGVGR
mgnify:CR=1 FL=1